MLQHKKKTSLLKRVSGARVLTSAKCIAILKKKEDKKKEIEDKERRKVEHEQKKKERDELLKKRAEERAKKAEQRVKKTAKLAQKKQETRSKKRPAATPSTLPMFALDHGESVVVLIKFGLTKENVLPPMPYATDKDSNKREGS